MNSKSIHIKLEQWSSTSSFRHGFLPPLIQPLFLASLHLRFESLLDMPLVRDVLFILPKTDGKSGEVSGAERGCFGDNRSHDGNTENVRLKLAEKIVAGRTAVDSQLACLDP